MGKQSDPATGEHDTAGRQQRTRQIARDDIRARQAPVERGQGAPSSHTHLDQLASQVSRNGRFLAHTLAAIQREQGLTDHLLALVLAMPVDSMATLRLCSKPRPDHWQADIAAIARSTHCDPERLSDLLLAYAAHTPPTSIIGS
jgi:deferrochelatase/peroxidase EfeB